MSDISTEASEQRKHHSLAHPTDDESKSIDGRLPQVVYDEEKAEGDVNAKELSRGVANVEATVAALGNRSRWITFICLGLACYIYSLDGNTTYLFLAEATSNFLKHSLTGTVTTAAAIIIAVGKPFMGKLADSFGRGETYVIVALLYMIGYILIASAQTINQLAAGDIIYSLGYTGLQIMTQVVLADMTSLRYRGLATGLVAMPYVINGFVAAEIAQGIIGRGGWRWGYGMFAIMVPVLLFPIAATLIYGQHKAKKLALRAQVAEPLPPVLEEFSRATGKQKVVAGANVVVKPFVLFSRQVDLVGLILIAAALALILLPLTLAAASSRGWQTPSMIAMIVIGVVLIIPCVLWEIYGAERFGFQPIAPQAARFFKNFNIAAACAIGFLDFVSFYLQYTYQYSFIVVVKTSWSTRIITYFSSTQTIALTVFGCLAGIIMAYTQRMKALLVIGLCIRIIGVGLMIRSKGALGSDALLVFGQVLQGVGGGFAATIIQTAAQARVAHVDVAVVTALVLLITEVGNSVGSAIATAVWTSQMPKALATYVPTTNATLLAELYGSITNIAAYDADSPIRQGAIVAYSHVMKNLCIGATVVAIFPPIIAYFFIDDIRLDERQNAFDNRGVDGRPVEETEAVDASSKSKWRFW